MFDTKIYRSDYSTPYEKNVNVTEKRAPTDDSIRIFNEIKAKAFQSIIRSMPCADNNIKFNAFVSDGNVFSSFEKRIYYNFKLNGEEFDGYITLNRGDFYDNDIIEKVYKRMAEAITGCFLKRSIQDGTIKDILGR